jgi:type IV pilus assembly protein PilE
MRHLRSVQIAGFTLIEVMITVAIVGVLASIALPAYWDSVTRSKLIDGTTKLGDFRAQLEKWFLDNRTYQAVPTAGTNCGVANPVAGASDAFAITCTAGTAFSYTITATGRAAAGMSASFVYTVDQANQKTSTGPSGWVGNATCWAVRKDGSCQ